MKPIIGIDLKRFDDVHFMGDPMFFGAHSERLANCCLTGTSYTKHVFDLITERVKSNSALVLTGKLLRADKKLKPTWSITQDLLVIANSVPNSSTIYIIVEDSEDCHLFNLAIAHLPSNKIIIIDHSANDSLMVFVAKVVDYCYFKSSQHVAPNLHSYGKYIKISNSVKKYCYPTSVDSAWNDAFGPINFLDLLNVDELIRLHQNG